MIELTNRRSNLIFGFVFQSFVFRDRKPHLDIVLWFYCKITGDEQISGANCRFKINMAGKRRNRSFPSLN